MLTVGAIFLGLLIAGALVGLELTDRFLACLRALHPDIWEALDAPSRYFDDFGRANRTAVHNFWKRTDFQARCGPELLRSARLIRTYVRVYLLLAVFGLLVFLLLSWKGVL